MIIEDTIEENIFMFGHRLQVLTDSLLGDKDSFVIDKVVDFKHRIVGIGNQNGNAIAGSRFELESDWKHLNKLPLNKFHEIINKFKSFPYKKIEGVACVGMLDGASYTVVLRLDGQIYKWVLRNPDECGFPYDEISVFLDGIVRKKYKSWIRKFP